jgi:hypothetical protein
MRLGSRAFYFFVLFQPINLKKKKIEMKIIL